MKKNILTFTSVLCLFSAYTTSTHAAVTPTCIGTTKDAVKQSALHNMSVYKLNYINECGVYSTIYVRMVIGQTVTQVVSGTQVVSEQDLSFFIYSDAACTQPLILTSPLTLSVNEKEVLVHGTGGSGNFTKTYTVPSGVSSYDEGNVITEIVDSGARTTTLYQYTLNNVGTYTPEP